MYITDNIHMNFLTNLFKGRINRSTYLLGELLVIIPSLLIQYIRNDQSDNVLLQLVAMCIFLPTIIFAISLTVRRLHDCNQHGIWFLLTFIPIGNLGLVLFTLFKRGDKGPNRFGPAPA